MTRWIAALLTCLALAPHTWARTIELTCWDLTGGAVISAEAPRVSWAGSYSAPTKREDAGVFSSAGVDIYMPRMLMMRFDLSQIPKDMRITNAELVLPIAYQHPPDMHLVLYRLLADWGAGVCYDFRTQRPEKVAWAKPGAQGAGIDRALRPSARVSLNKVETDLRISVTSDLELWHQGSAPNHGWILVTEDPGFRMMFSSPVYGGREKWRLRITYEPKS